MSNNCLICSKILTNYRGLTTHLRFTHNMKSQEYYHLYVLKETEVNPPNCLNPICRNKVKWIHKKYLKYCSHSCQLVLRHQDPEFAKRRDKRSSMVMTQLNSDPDFKQGVREHIIAKNKSEEGRESSSQAMSKLWESTEFRETRRKAASDRWNDSEYRAMKTKEASETFKKLWETKEYRDRRVKKSSETMTKLHQDPEFSKRHIERTSKSFSKSSKRRWQDPEYRDKITSRARDNWKDPELRKRMSRGISGEYNSIKSGIVLYKSSWELRVYKNLDEDPTVINYVAEPFHIDYKLDGSDRVYIPDILINYTDNKKILVEIKPKAKMDLEINQIKFQAARKYCEEIGIDEFQVWTRENVFKEKSCV